MYCILPHYFKGTFAIFPQGYFIMTPPVYENLEKHLPPLPFPHPAYSTLYYNLAQNSKRYFKKYLKQIRKNRWGGGISIFVHESLSFKRREDLGINSEALESPSIEILNKCKNIIPNTIYRPPNGDIETCETYFKNLFSNNDTVNKHTLFFYKHTGKLCSSSICLRFSQFEPKVMFDDGMLNFKTHFMV